MHGRQRGFQYSISPKMTPQEISHETQDLLFERGAQKIFYKSY